MKNVGFQERGAVVKVSFGSVETRTEGTSDYNRLANRPSIEGILLEGDVSLPEIGVRSIQYHTEAEWNAQQTLLTQEGALYIYSDHSKLIDPTTGEVTVIPAIKIGDGVSYLSQLPFIGGVSDPVTEEKIDEISESVEQITATVDEITLTVDNLTETVNKKIQAAIDQENTENLVLF